MKKRFVVLLIIITVLIAGAAGFGGAYLANNISNASLAENANLPAYSSRTDQYLDAGKSEANRNGDSSASANTADSSPGFVPLISSPSNKQKSQQLTIPEIAAFASNSVVEIYTESVTSSGRMGQFVTEGAGSGVIVTSDGYIATNNHVIEGSRKITVRLSNGEDYEAELIGRDSKADIAVIKIDASGLQPVVFGNSDELQVGELAVAIGNPLGKLGGSVTEGIISALSRSIEIDGHMMTLLQTSAAVNPGNSGGGLFNNYGEMIGIVNAKSSGSDIEGIGFAIPANLAKSIIEALIQYGYVPGRIDFGATLINILDPMTAMMYRVPTTGVYVSEADPESPLRAGDRIVSIDGKEIRYAADVTELLDEYNVGDVLSIILSRGNSTGYMTVELALKQAKS